LSRKKDKPKKGSLINDALEDIPRKFLKNKNLKKELKEVLIDNPGIYALYLGNKLKYVGLSIDLYRRSKGRSLYDKKNWDNIKFFQFRNRKHLKDVETFFLRILKPPWNDAGGKFKHEGSLEKSIIKKIKKSTKQLAREKQLSEETLKRYKKSGRKINRRIKQLQKQIETQKLLKNTFKDR